MERLTDTSPPVYSEVAESWAPLLHPDQQQSETDFEPKTNASNTPPRRGDRVIDISIPQRHLSCTQVEEAQRERSWKDSSPAAKAFLIYFGIMFIGTTVAIVVGGVVTFTR